MFWMATKSASLTSARWAGAVEMLQFSGVFQRLTSRVPRVVLAGSRRVWSVRWRFQTWRATASCGSGRSARPHTAGRCSARSTRRGSGKPSCSCCARSAAGNPTEATTGSSGCCPARPPPGSWPAHWRCATAHLRRLLRPGPAPMPPTTRRAHPPTGRASRSGRRGRDPSQRRG